MLIIRQFITMCLGIWLVSCTDRNIERVIIRGSDTEVNLVLQLAEQFMDQHPNVSVAVTGGGSGTGIASLLNKRTDIANSSRAFSDYELQLATKREVDVHRIVFAMDALCFIVNASLNVDTLSLEQIRQIFTGEIRNWSHYTAYQAPISLYGRQSNSGTYIYIRDSILGGDYALYMKQMNGSSQIVEGVRNDQAAIGYVGIGYALQKNGQEVEGINILSISTSAYEAFYPGDPEQILNGNYPIVRPLFQYTDGRPAGPTREFLLYELSREGQKIIQDGAYFPIPSIYQQANHLILGHESD